MKLQNWQSYEIRLAYEDGVPEAVKEMKKYDEEWQWEEIRWAYENGVHEEKKRELS